MQMQCQASHNKRITANVPSELTTISMLTQVLSGELPPPSSTPSIKAINNPVEAVIHTNFLPPLKGTSYELYKFGYLM